MKIPKIISKNNHEYIFVRKCNDKLYQYKDMQYGYVECFSKFDLGLVKEMIKPPKYSISMEKPKF